MRINGPRRVGSTDVTVTAVGFGSASVGNRFRAMTEAECSALVDDAWDHGVRFFDTAPMYGHGLSEGRLGVALRGRPRDEYVLSTKVGRLLRPSSKPDIDAMWIDVPPMRIEYDYGYDGTLRSIDDSLQRMLTDRIDIAFIHDCDRYGHGESQPQVFEEAMRGAARALVELRDQGVIGAVGIGVNEADVCVAAVERSDLDVVLLAGRYTLLEQAPLDVLMPLCLERRVGLVLGGVFNSGILASGTGPAAHHNYGPVDGDVAIRVERIAAMCRHHGVPLAALAVQFAAAHPAVCSILLGASRIDQQERNYAAATVDIPAELWTELRDGHLIRPDAPTPG